MQIQAVLDFCMEFLISAIDVNTCVDIIHIAEVFGMPQLEDKEIVWTIVSIDILEN